MGPFAHSRSIRVKGISDPGVGQSTNRHADDYPCAAGAGRAHVKKRADLPTPRSARIDCTYSPDEGTTRRLFVTSNVPGTPLALMFATFLSVSLSTTPSSVTRPPFTMM